MRVASGASDDQRRGDGAMELSRSAGLGVFAHTSPFSPGTMLRSSSSRKETCRGDAFAATLSAAVVTLAGLLVLLSQELGPRAVQMLLHIAAMNVAAPVAAAIVADRLPSAVTGTRALWLSAVAQLVLLWAWHLPGVERAVSTSHGLHAAGHLALAAASFVFWCAVVRAPAHGRWHAIAALLVTGKLACLLSALLVFSPRVLYGGTALEGPFEDQQLAGLLMITACPLSYLVAAVVIVARLIDDAPAAERNAAPAAERRSRPG